MDALVDMIVRDSTSLDVYVIVRLIVFIVIMELFALICAYLGNLKK